MTAIKYDEIEYEAETAVLRLDGEEVDRIDVTSLVQDYLDTNTYWGERTHRHVNEPKYDPLDIRNATKAKQVWVEKVLKILDPITADDINVYYEPEYEDNDCYDDGFAHCTRNHVRFVTWVGEVSDRVADRKQGVWVRKVDKAIAKVK